MKFLSISSAFLLLVVSQAAVALPSITGSIDITGNSIVLDDGGTPASATGINWLDLDPGTAGDQGVVSAASGSFASGGLLCRHFRLHCELHNPARTHDDNPKTCSSMPSPQYHQIR